MSEIIDHQESPELTVGGIINSAFSVGLKNAPSLIGATLLYLLTIWIPYLNVGTTIAMSTIPVSLSRGKIISPMEIFNSKYRKSMGDYFLLQGFMFMGILMAMMFMVIPAYVLIYSWILAPMLLVDKELSASEALTESNKRTYGYKWVIFGGLFVLTLIVYALIILVAFLSINIGILGYFLLFIVLCCIFPIILGGLSEVYRCRGN